MFYLSSPVKAVVGIATATLVAAAAGAEAVAAAGAAAGAAAAGAAAAGAATAASSAILVISSNFFLRSAIMFSSFFSFACSFLISAYGDRNRHSATLLVGVNSYLHAFNLLKMPPGLEVSHLNSVNAEHWLGAERQHQQGEAGQFHCDGSEGQQQSPFDTQKCLPLGFGMWFVSVAYACLPACT